jgi:polyhydroxyalkanoate synthesis regulator phasin
VARGRYKAKAEAKKTSASIQELEDQVNKLTEENMALKAQLDQNIQHHAYQLAAMYEQTTNVTSPRIQELEEEVLRLKKALRGVK